MWSVTLRNDSANVKLRVNCVCNASSGTVEVMTGMYKAFSSRNKLKSKLSFFLQSSNKEPYYAASLRSCLAISADALSPCSLLIDVPLFPCFRWNAKTAALIKIASVGHQWDNIRRVCLQHSVAWWLIEVQCSACVIFLNFEHLVAYNTAVVSVSKYILPKMSVYFLQIFIGKILDFFFLMTRMV